MLFNKAIDVDYGGKGKRANTNEGLEIAISEMKAKVQEFNRLRSGAQDNLHPRILNERLQEFIGLATDILINLSNQNYATLGEQQVWDSYLWR